MLVRAAASDWQSDVVARDHHPGPPEAGQRHRRPRSRAPPRSRASFRALARSRAYSKEESARLLEPWLGSGARAARSAGAAHHRGAARAQRDARSRAAAQAADRAGRRRQPRRPSRLDGPDARHGQHHVLGGIGVLLLVFAATMLSVAFATRGAMAANRPIVEVLHFIGATDGFIAGQFQRHFLVLGLEGGADRRRRRDRGVHARRGGRQWGFGLAGGEQLADAVRHVRAGHRGLCRDRSCRRSLIAVVTALTSRHTVNQTLRTIE